MNLVSEVQFWSFSTLLAVTKLILYCIETMKRRGTGNRKIPYCSMWRKINSFVANDFGGVRADASQGSTSHRAVFSKMF